ncbi:MAG TPA: hypothetical protein VMN03_14590, partial [Burkholderiales bacterium]|nr:hypothetical protein [Burkholderiales bacterium]
WAAASNSKTSSNGALSPPSQRRRARERGAVQNPVGARGLLGTLTDFLSYSRFVYLARLAS